MRRFSWFNLTTVALGIAFLYLPIVILVIYSFNASRLVTVWGGWSLRWYGELMSDSAILEAAVMSLAIAGLSLLLLFVAVDWDRGFWTVTIAHTTLTMCFVAVVVQSRLVTFDTSLEEAAMDLGCPPWKTFLTVTLPLIWPAIAAGWMLAFTLSLDDLIIASFTTGPGATTLPIRIYSQVRLGVKPEINAICTILIAVVALGLITASLLAKRSQMEQEGMVALGAVR